MSRDAKIMTAIVAIIAVVMVGAFTLANKGVGQVPTPTPSADKLIGTDPHKLGKEGAKVTLVEFGDYQCPACGQAHPALKQIVKDYGDRIQFVFRNYPLPQHSNAQAAAQVAEEASSQGKFWEMHDKLYDTQKDWENLSAGDAQSKFLSYANDLGIDANKVKAAIEDEAHAKRIAQDQADGNALGIQGTPSFYVNGKAVQGIDYPTLRDAIEAALKG